MRRIWVNIDLQKLSLRLWQSRGEPMTVWDLRQWLAEADCVHERGAWYACATTDHLQADEIVEVLVRETIEGITFINRQRRDRQRL